MHKEIVHLFLLYVFVFLDKLTELFLDMSDDERINDIYLVESNYFSIIIINAAFRLVELLLGYIL